MQTVRIGALSIVMDYFWHPKGKKITYRRRIPEEVRKHYPDSQKFVTRSTGTHEKQQALPLLHKINAEYKAEWERMRHGMTDQSTLDKALEILRQHGLTPRLGSSDQALNEQQQLGLDLFAEYMDRHENDELYHAKIHEP